MQSHVVQVPDSLLSLLNADSMLLQLICLPDQSSKERTWEWFAAQNCATHFVVQPVLAHVPVCCKQALPAEC